MSWHSGTNVMEALIKAARRNVKDEDSRVAIYRDVIPALIECDWWDYQELIGEDIAYDRALKELGHDEGFDDSED